MTPHLAQRLNNPRFRFRNEEITRIHHCWAEAQSVLLTGIRRTGKTEVLKAALHRYAQAGNAVAHLDVQDQNSLPRFYQDLLEALLNAAPPTLGERLLEVMGQVRRVPTAVTIWLRGQVRKVSIPDTLEVELTPAPDSELVRYWQPLAEQIGSVLAEHEPSQLPVIGLDELPFMLENLIRAGVSTAELTIMLASLRKLRDAGLRLIIAGSISFENLLTLQNIPHTVLGGLARHNIPPFSVDEARLYLAEKLQGRPAGDAAALELILGTLPDYVPEFLRITAIQLHTSADAAACAHDLTHQVMPAIRRSFLKQFDERLDKNYGNGERGTVNQLLDIIATADPAGTRIDSSQLPDNHRHVLLKLEYDNFLIEGDDFKWRFSLNLIRIWWRANRGMA